MTVLLPSFIADGNWFLLALAGPVACLVALTHPRCRVHLGDVSRPSQKRLYLLWGLLLTSSMLLVLGISLEVYHSHGCPNSALFHLEIETLARFVYEFCRRQHMSYWVAFGNLLFVLRGDRRIPVGDTDSDIGVVKAEFMRHFGSIRNFSAVVQTEGYQELQRSVHVVYHSERDLIQLYLDNETKGSHADIWLYHEETDETKWLVNEDRTIRAKWLVYDQVLPLQKEPAWFLNVPVTLPRNMSYLARAEYGSDYMTPITMRMECMENVLNGYTFYKLPMWTKSCYAITFGVLVATLTLLPVYYIPSLSRAIRRKRGPKLRPHEAAPRASDKDFV